MGIRLLLLERQNRKLMIYKSPTVPALVSIYISVMVIQCIFLQKDGYKNNWQNTLE